MKTIRAVLIAGLSWVVVSQADAQVLTFDEINPPDNAIRTSLSCGETDGFLFTSPHFHAVGTVTNTQFSSDGTTHIGYESARGYPITMSRVGAGTFSLLSMDVGEFYNTDVFGHPDANKVLVTGIMRGGQTVSHIVTLDGIHDGVGGEIDFEHFVLPGTFVDLTTVIFTGLLDDGSDGGLALDNLEYQFEFPAPIHSCVLVAETPTVAIAAPVPGLVMGTTAVQATATDDVAVVGVQVTVDGMPLGAELTEPPYTVAWDTTTVADGPHTVSVQARDATNNMGTASVVVTVRNAPVTTPAYYVELDGVSDYVEVADADALSFGTGTADQPLTIETWFRPDTMAGKQNLVSKWSWQGAVHEYRLYIAPGPVLRLDLRDASAGVTVSVLTNGQAGLVGGWHHLAVTYDGRGGATAADGVTFYIDGVAVPVTRQNNVAYVAMENWTAPLELGCETVGFQQFDGGLDEVRLWNAVRTPSEIQAALLSTLTGSEAGLVAYWRFDEGAGMSVDDDSPNTHTGTFHNAVTWMAGGPMAPPEPDVTAPTIDDLTTSDVTESSATISFTTSEAATGWVSYTGATCPCSDVYSAGPGTVHVMTLTGLAPDTAYDYQPNATDAAGNRQVGVTVNFRTLALAGDTTAPVVEIAGRAPGPVTGTVVLQVTATDDVAVVGVQVRVDGVALGAELTDPPYAVAWDTTTVADGPHTVSVEARDAANNVGTASAVMTVENAPPPTFVDPNGTNAGGVPAVPRGGRDVGGRGQPEHPHGHVPQHGRADGRRAAGASHRGP